MVFESKKKPLKYQITHIATYVYVTLPNINPQLGIRFLHCSTILR